MLESSVNTSSKFTTDEKGLTAKLAGLFSIRMLGIFIILPILVTYSQSLEGSTPVLTGLVFASYAITQILLQPIFGIVSDKIGRKPALIVGLALFTLGSLVLVFTSNIYIAILGRIIQGSGAVSAVVLAMATDLTREQIRSKVMAFIGVSIGLTFGIAISIAPIIYYLAKGYGIFGLCALLGLAGIYVTIKYIPEIPIPPKADHHKESFKELAQIAFKENNVVRLYFGAFMLHLLLTMTFATLPILFKQLEISTVSSAFYYTATFFVSIIVMFIFVGLAEKFYKHRILFLFAIILLAASYLFMLISADGSRWLIIISLALFFFGFNIMEASQPSLMSRFADQNYRGTIMGIFSSSQFLGASIGGMLGSVISGYFGVQYVFYLTFLLTALWFVIAWPMQNPIKPTKQSNTETTDEVIA
ncbi:MFS transporter [Wohlfahrtiimonas larvae]|uniref:MFS transporter n=1 Tax=Wohlfahrtiimonas larvae TaxID=1157986 RepID=A0ABP9MHN2_9GAMM|nr:MFS transporter [Wohlfahrtiimonas larvae]